LTEKKVRRRTAKGFVEATFHIPKDVMKEQEKSQQQQRRKEVAPSLENVIKVVWSLV
jgi:hypothetical protein